MSKAYEITKDDESRTDLYVTKSSVDAVMDTSGTVTAWKNSIKSYPDSSLKAYEDALKLVNGPVQAAGQVWNSIQAQRVSIEEVLLPRGLRWGMRLR